MKLNSCKLFVKGREFPEFINASFGFQKFEQFGARYQQLATQCAADLEFAPLDQAVNTEVIYPKQIGCFPH